MDNEDGVDLPKQDYRRIRRYLAPHVFATCKGEEVGLVYPPPSDLLPENIWAGLMDLPTDVALRTSSHEGTAISRLNEICSGWEMSRPFPEKAPFLESATLLVSEELDALLFNALHGYFRQAIGCLRNVLETMMEATSYAVTNDLDSLEKWQAGEIQSSFRKARERILRKTGWSTFGITDPTPVFGDAPTSLARSRYERLCGFAHSRGGHNNGDFWESNGPVFVPEALKIVEDELRETATFAYLLLRLGWTEFRAGPAVSSLLKRPALGWEEHTEFLRRVLESK